MLSHQLVEPIIDVYVDVNVTKERDDEDQCSESQVIVTSKPLKNEYIY